MESFVYILTHTWCFADGTQGRYEVQFNDVDEAFARFKYLQFLIENDEYEFNAHFTPYVEGDMSYSVYEDEHSLMNRQDLVLKQVEVSL